MCFDLNGYIFHPSIVFLRGMVVLVAAADFLLIGRVDTSLLVFKAAFLQVAQHAALGLFRPAELEELCYGSPEWNLADVEKHARYFGGYTAESPQIKWFWEIAHTMSRSFKRQLLLFITGSSRVPVPSLHTHSIAIQRTSDPQRLMVAHTCFNL